jgi:glycosyltransferase involved in cell wall biosynthesis
LTAPPAGQQRVLIAIPAYNEETTIATVIRQIQDALPEADVLVVDDGSQDGTREIVRRLAVPTAIHICNLGYGRAIQTAIKYALRQRYQTLITIDADGQHDPAQLRPMLDAFSREGWDYLIGSRYVRSGQYGGAPLARKLGMQIFSVLTKLFTGHRIYDTTSGFRILGQPVLSPLMHWHFVDFHAETIVFLLHLGFRVGEYPITALARRHGSSMYSLLSHFTYPLQTILMLLLGVVEATLTRRSAR